MTLLEQSPGRIFVAAALLPLAASAVLFVIGLWRHARQAPPVRTALAGWFAALIMALATACSFLGTAWLWDDMASQTINQALDQTTGQGNNPGSSAGNTKWSESVPMIQIGSQPAPTNPTAIIELGYSIDRLTALMMCMVTFVGTFITIFAIGYLDEERGWVEDHEAAGVRRGRFMIFFQHLLLFCFSMLALLISDNLLQIFVCWELVGVCSFLLIGFYFERSRASTAANKAFIINRVGDAGFLIGLAILFAAFGTWKLQELTQQFSVTEGGGLTRSLWIIAGLGIFAGCVGKSAQVPLHTWLPDAMEGPTPVSALIHAATMVAAGVYLAARCLPLFAPEVLTVIAWVGAITLLLSAATATVQTDIKRVLAFSTCSQLGYMMLALGLTGWSAGLFHLLTHAFFKALLFLCAGSVICALHHEQNLLKMGGLRGKMPITAGCMLIGVAAIIGVPMFSGWYSKDQILSLTWANWKNGGEGSDLLLAIISFGTVILTAYYMSRLWILAFAGTPRNQQIHDHAHESPPVMTVPLLILAVCSIGIAWGWPIWKAEASWLSQALIQSEPAALSARLVAIRQAAHECHLEAEIGGLLCGLVGVVTAVIRFRRGDWLVESNTLLARLFSNRFYFDHLYDRLFTRSTITASRAVGMFDKQQEANAPATTLDEAFNQLGLAVARTGQALAPLQSGRIRSYVALLGLTASAGLAILWLIHR